MRYKLISMLFIYFWTWALAADDIYVNGQLPQDVVDQGRAQYQLLRERGTLPKYGTCWTSAVAHVHEGCKYLTEDVQSDIALHLTNCFLAMSGHETYNCEHDKKPNLRGICINSMTDRAFNVYTEFYTHTQNICWFLRGQIWHETISENTHKVGKQLEESAKNQDQLLAGQQASLELQEKLAENGRALEETLSELYASTKAHREILNVMTLSMENFQAWIIGEISWFDSLVFYLISIFFVTIFTSSKRTAGARLPLLFGLFANFLVERFICFVLLASRFSLINNFTYTDINSYIWYCRYIFIIFNMFYLIYKAFYYRDLIVENNRHLDSIKHQNNRIIELLLNIKNNNNNNNNNNNRQNVSNYRVDLINETTIQNGYCEEIAVDYVKNGSCIGEKSHSNSFCNEENMREKSLDKSNHSPSLYMLSRRPQLLLAEIPNGRYNLRSKQNTPERFNSK